MPRLIQRNSTAVALLCAVWAAMAVVANPIGNFALNDDWVYGQAVKTFLTEHQIRICDWTDAAFIVQLLWGYAVTAVFGFSYTVLRFSVLFLGLGGVLALYALLRECSASRAMAFLGALTLAVNPIYFNLSCTFMTDVPFLALAILSCFLLIRGMRRESASYLLAGSVAAVAATLTRQIGLIIPASFAVAYVIQNRWRPNAFLVGSVACIAAAAAYLGYNHVLTASSAMPVSYLSREEMLFNALKEHPLAIASRLANELSNTACYVGLFLLPILPVSLRITMSGASKRARIVSFVAGAAVTLAIALHLLHRQWLMPLLLDHGNLFYNFGLGPPALHDAWILGLGENVAIAAIPPRIALTLLTVLAAGLLVAQLALSISQAVSATAEARSGRGATIMALSAAGLYFVPVALTGILDRYLIVLVPLMLMAVLSPPLYREEPLPRIALAIGSAAAVLWAFFASAGTHDYLAWSRAKWAAIDHLLNEVRAKPEQIDAGPEFNGAHFYTADYHQQKGKSWWWVRGDKYRVTFGPEPDRHILKEFAFTRFIPPRRDSVFILDEAPPEGKRSIEMPFTLRHKGENIILRDGTYIRYWKGDGSSAPVNISYGGHIALPAGKYKAVFEYRAATPKRDVRHSWGTFSIVAFDNGPRIVEAEVEHVPIEPYRYRAQDLVFDLAESKAVEVQVTGADAALWLKRVLFEPVEK